MALIVKSMSLVKTITANGKNSYTGVIKMSLVSVLVVMVIIGFALWLVNAYIPMLPPFKIVLNAIVVLILVLWILQVFGLIPGMNVRL